jgi:hypothetical protein
MTDIDAWEHQQKLNQDPEYQAMLKAKKEQMDRKSAEIQAIENDFIEEWNRNGFTPIRGTGVLLSKEL